MAAASSSYLSRPPHPPARLSPTDGPTQSRHGRLPPLAVPLFLPSPPRFPCEGPPEQRRRHCCPSDSATNNVHGPHQQFGARLRTRRKAATHATAAGVKRQKAVSNLEERERAVAVGQTVDPAEPTRREDKSKATDIKSELEDFFTAKQSTASSAASTSVKAQGDKKGGTPQDGAKTDKDMTNITRLHDHVSGLRI